jgi:hypothetical protein
MIIEYIGDIPEEKTSGTNRRPQRTLWPIFRFVYEEQEGGLGKCNVTV